MGSPLLAGRGLDTLTDDQQTASPASRALNSVEGISNGLDMSWWQPLDLEGNTLPEIAPARPSIGIGIGNPSQVPKVARHLTHLSTSLIEYWFCRVCPMWSVFDSDVNYNRQIAQDS